MRYKKHEIITVDQLLADLDKYAHRELHVHHTWRPDHSNFNGSNGAQLSRNMENYHVNTNKWSDIAQHITLLPDGLCVVGRAFNVNPASISGHNTGAFCVEMIGNFDVGNDKFDGKQKDAMLRIAKYFDDKKRYVRFHNENASKTCPGTSIDKATFMREVKEYGKTKEVKRVNANVKYEGKNVVGFIEDGRTYVQVRDLCEMLGLKLSYDASTKTVTIKK